MTISAFQRRMRAEGAAVLQRGFDFAVADVEDAAGARMRAAACTWRAAWSALARQWMSPLVGTIARSALGRPHAHASHVNLATSGWGRRRR